MKTKLVTLGQSLFSGLGLLWLLLGAYYGLNPLKSDRIGFVAFLIIGVVIGLMLFVINGLWVSGFLKRSIEITSNAIDTAITVMFGDLFAQDGCKAISVNEFFDSEVDDKHVAANTLHGLMLTRFWADNISDWDSQVAQELAGTSPVDTVTTRPDPGKHARYDIGTTVSVSAKDYDFLCVVLAKTDTTSLQASASSEDLHHAVRGLLAKARTVCAGRPLNIPLLGSGLARTGIKPNIIVYLILLAIFEESKKRKITNEIRIVLPKNMRKIIDLSTIQKGWK